MSRWLRNLVRIPVRTLRSMERRRDPAFRLQRRADRAVSALIPAARRLELEAIAGNSSNRENRLLAYLALEAPRGGCVVEIGAFWGKSTAWLVEAAQRRTEPIDVISIDPHLSGSWEGYQETVQQFALEERGLTVVRAMSHDVGSAWNRPISFLWIDGSHEYDDVIHDIEDFTPHVMLGGRVVFDDAGGIVYPGVARAIDERMRSNPDFVRVGQLKQFAIFERVCNTAPGDDRAGVAESLPVQIVDVRMKQSVEASD